MLTVLSLTGPFFAVIGLGFLAGRRGWMPVDAVRSLNVFVFYFAMPALIIRAMADQDIATALSGPAVLVWLSAGLAMFWLAAGAMRILFAAPLEEMALAGQAASIGNLGFLALPLLLLTFGDRVAPLIAIALIVDLMVLIPLSIGLLEWARGRGRTREILTGVAKGMLINPFILAIVAGTLVALMPIGLPQTADRLLDFLGDAAGATALFALGVSLAERRIGGDGRAIALLCFLKLGVHPFLILTAASLFSLAAPQTALLMVIAAMPIAGNVFVIAERYGVLVQRLSTAILLSNMLAVATVSIAILTAQG